jgi:dihydropyrimidinase
MTRSDFVRATSTAAAHVFNLFPRKGILAPGADADVVIFDPDVTHVISAAAHHSRMDTNIYEGYKVQGKVRQEWPPGRSTEKQPANTEQGLRLQVYTSMSGATPSRTHSRGCCRHT